MKKRVWFINILKDNAIRGAIALGINCGVMRGGIALHGLDELIHRGRRKKSRCDVPIIFQRLLIPVKFIRRADKCCQQGVKVAALRKEWSQVDANNLPVGRNGVNRWLGIFVAQLHDFTLQSYASFMAIRHGMFTAQRRLMDEFINILNLHFRIAGEV